jgi:signal transduction histidine kinase
VRRITPRAWPIRWWLTALNVGVLVATLLALGGLFLSQVDNALIDITAEHLRDQARPILQPRRPVLQQRGPGAAPPPRDVEVRDAGQLPRSELYEPGPPPPGGDLPAPRPPVGAASPPFNALNVANFIVGALRGPDTGAAVFDMNGELIAVSETGETMEPWPLADPDQVRGVLDGTEYQAVVGQESRRTLMLLVPWFNAEGARVGAVQVTRSLELTDQVGARLRLALLIGTVLAALMAGVIGFRATRAALRPLDRVITAARKIEAGEMGERLHLTRRDEIGELAEAFDTMLDRLAAALAAQKRFVADAAHELRTPLTALGGAVEMLQLGADRGDRATVQRLLTGMEREIARLTRLVTGLLALSRLDADQPLSQGPVNLAVLLSDVADETRVLAQGQRVSCYIDAVPSVVGDGDRLKQALLNLSANALAYTPADGRIEFRLSSTNGTAHLTVSDTGCGIDPKLLPRVMERFVRGDQSRSRETGGAGLGLAIAHSIVEAHGGAISLESHPGQGTRARIDLPTCSAARMA